MRWVLARLTNLIQRVSTKMGHEERHGHEEHEYHEEVIKLLKGIEHTLKRILRRFEPRSAVLTLESGQGEIKMPLTVKMGDNPGGAVFQEFDGPNGTGNKVAPVGAVVYSSDNPAVATIDPSTGAFAYISPGVANITGADNGAGGLSASDALTVMPATPVAPVSATLTLQPGQ